MSVRGAVLNTCKIIPGLIQAIRMKMNGRNISEFIWLFLLEARSYGEMNSTSYI